MLTLKPRWCEAAVRNFSDLKYNLNHAWEDEGSARIGAWRLRVLASPHHAR